MKTLLAILASLAIATASFGTITSPQFLHVYSGGTSNNGTFSTSFTAGDLIVVFMSDAYDGGAYSATCTDSLGNTYTQIEQPPGVGDMKVTAWYAYNVIGGSCTITTSSINGHSDVGFTAIEYHSSAGSFTSNPIGGHGSLVGVGGGASTISVSFTTTAAGVLVGEWACEDYNVITGWTSNLSQIQHDGSHWDAQSQGLNMPAAAYTEGAVVSNHASNCIVTLLAFNEPTAAPAIVNNFLFFFSLIFAPYGLRPTPEPLFT